MSARGASSKIKVGSEADLIARLTLTLLLVIGGATLLNAAQRAEFDAAYRKQLAQLADKCESLGLTQEAATTRTWFIERLPDRQYLFVPPARMREAPTDKLKRQWQERFLTLRREQAARLFELSQRALDAGDASAAYRLLHEVLREDPDHAQARAVLGFRKADGVWRVPGATTGVRKASLAHGLVKDFKPSTYWRVTSTHFQVATNAGAAEGQQFAEQLERLHTVWRQVFFRYWSSEADLKRRFASPQVAAKPKKPFDVVLFKTREDYLTNLASADPRLAVTQGIYLDQQATSFFYLGDPRTSAICNHEVTHQLFQETGDAVRSVGEDGNFWVVEGIALYFESLRAFSHDEQADVITLGGWDADRLQFARHHVFNGRFQLPLAQLSAFTRKELQADKEIKRLYSQAAGCAHYLMDAQHGKYRRAMETYLAGVYAGRAEAQTLAQLTGVSFDEHDQAYQQFLRVSDKDLLSMDDPKAIRNLSLGHQAINDQGLARLAACENLAWLDVAATKVTDNGLASLAGLKQLTQLNLERTATTDETLEWLGKHTQLRELDLSHTKITDAGVAQLAGLTSLEVLWLTGTPITDASVPALQKLTKLTTLDLEGTRISARFLESLRPKP